MSLYSYEKKIVIIASILYLTFLANSVVKGQWVQTNGLIEENIQALAVSGSNLYAGTSDNGIFLSTNNGANWISVNSGLANKNVYALAVNGSYLFAGTYGGGVFCSTNSGASWTPVNNGLSNTSVVSLLANGTDLFAGTAGGGVFHSTDSGTNWTAEGLIGSAIGALAASGTNLFAGTGGVFLSTDKGKNWNKAGLTGLYVLALAVLDTNLFAAVEASGAFLTIDNGISWTNVSEDIPNINLAADPVTALSVFDTNIFAGSGSGGGVYVSSNDGTSWNWAGDGLTLNDFVNAFAECDTILFAGTGGGVWRRPLSDFGISSVAQTPVATQSDIQSYPNPFTQSTTITLTTPASGEAELLVVNLLGKEVARLYNGELGAGEHSFSWDASGLPIGTYFGVVRINGRTQELPMLLSR